jgi:hypothetical protein
MGRSPVFLLKMTALNKMPFAQKLGLNAIPGTKTGILPELTELNHSNPKPSFSPEWVVNSPKFCQETGLLTATGLAF